MMLTVTGMKRQGEEQGLITEGVQRTEEKSEIIVKITQP